MPFLPDVSRWPIPRSIGPIPVPRFIPDALENSSTVASALRWVQREFGRVWDAINNLSVQPPNNSQLPAFNSLTVNGQSFSFSSQSWHWFPPSDNSIQFYELGLHMPSSLSGSSITVVFPSEIPTGSQVTMRDWMTAATTILTSSDQITWTSSQALSNTSTLIIRIPTTY